MGLNINLNSFVVLENQLKNIQLEYEQKRAECNKKCGYIVKLKKEGVDTTSALLEIIELDKKITKLQDKLNKTNKIIEKKLKKLHNPPDYKNTQNLQIETLKKTSDLNTLKLKITKLCKVETTLKSAKNFISLQANKLFKQNELPFAIYCKRGVVLLCEQAKLDNLTNALLEYFKSNSLSIIERSVCKLKKSSCREFFIHLNRRLYLRLEIKREFYTREFNLKYRDQSIDTTKFVNQISITFI